MSDAGPADLDALVLVARGIETRIHQHNAVQLVVTLDRPYRASLDGGPPHAVHGFLADSNVPHACEGRASTVLVASLDAAGRKARMLRRRLTGRRWLPLAELVPSTRLRRFRDDWARSGSAFQPLSLVHELLRDTPEPPPVDARVVDTLRRIGARLESVPPVPVLARNAGVSERRLRELFRETLGIPVSACVLWTRTKRVLQLLRDPRVTLGDAAAGAGFADQAHLTRTFTRLFGVPPAVFRASADVLQVFGLEAPGPVRSVAG